MADLREPSIDSAQVVVMVLGTFGEIGQLSFDEIALALVLAHLAKDGIFLKVLRGIMISDLSWLGEDERWKRAHGRGQHGSMCLVKGEW